MLWGLSASRPRPTSLPRVTARASSCSVTRPGSRRHPPRGNRMAFFTLEDMEGTVEVTVFPEPFKTAAASLRSGEAVLVRGRVDDGDKGRVVLAEEVRLLEQALAESRGHPGSASSTVQASER